MIDYDYLDWGVGLPIEDDFKKIEYREQAKVKFFEVDPDEVLYEEGKEENDYDVWYLQLPTEKTWTEDPEQVEARRQPLKKKSKHYAASIVPGHELWRRGTSVFLDAFLLEPISDITETKI
jgi:hypothetical protein